VDRALSLILSMNHIYRGSGLHIELKIKLCWRCLPVDIEVSKGGPRGPTTTPPRLLVASGTLYDSTTQVALYPLYRDIPQCTRLIFTTNSKLLVQKQTWEPTCLMIASKNSFKMAQHNIEVRPKQRTLHPNDSRIPGQGQRMRCGQSI
jgi:hypothetical protein